MPVDFSDIKSKLVPISGTLLFMLYAVMLPRYTGTGKTWLGLLLARISGDRFSQNRESPS